MNANTSKRIRRMWIGLALAWLLGALLLTGCGDEEGMGAAPLPDFSGVWEGTLVEATSGNFGEVTLTVQQRHDVLDGTWTAVFPTVVNAGSLHGTASADGDTASLSLDSSAPGLCPMTATVVIRRNEAEGNYATISCPVLSTGTIHVYRDTADGPGYDPATPAAPTGVAVTAGDWEVTISWSSVSGASAYNLYWGTSTGLTPATGSKIARVVSPFTHTGLANGTGYHYVVTATNMGGQSGASAEVGATPQVPAPGAPTGISAAAGDGQVALSWNPVSGAESYNLYWATSPGVTKFSGNPITGVISPFTHTGLSNGTPYYYVVTAENAGAESAESAEVNATPEATPLVNTPAEAGLWENVTYTRHTAKIELQHSIDAAGQEQWSVHGWGFCGGGYCDWGAVPGSRLASGEVYAIWDVGWKTTEVWAKMSATQPGRLETYMWNNYADWDGRTDFGLTETYNRVQ